jgi:UDP-2,4-diacetamido-2,4,6-trideoxy-beta-L-altropyranose hydrolase
VNGSKVSRVKTADRKIAFRVDASTEIGTGHLMRCLTLASSLKKKGAQTRFTSRYMPKHLRDLIGTRGHDLVCFDDARRTDPVDELSHSGWLGTSQHADALDTTRVLSDCVWDWLVVDHYALDKRWETALHGVAMRVMVIDDLADRVHECEVLLDQNFLFDMDVRYDGKVPSHCHLLLGPCYALLREEFSKLRASMRMRHGPVYRILVLMGGVDADNQTEKAIQAIARLQGRSFEVDVVVGMQHPARDKLETMCKRHGFRYHIQTPNVAALMAAADVAIGAAGSSSWERCCLGLPTICLAQAAHQMAMAEGLEARGAVVNLGNAAKVSVEDLSGALLSLVDRPERLASLSIASSSLVDGKGADRVCQYLLSAA